MRERNQNPKDRRELGTLGPAEAALLMILAASAVAYPVVKEEWEEFKQQVRDRVDDVMKIGLEKVMEGAAKGFIEGAVEAETERIQKENQEELERIWSEIEEERREKEMWIKHNTENPVCGFRSCIGKKIIPNQRSNV